jgi:hypothetical protein
VDTGASGDASFQVIRNRTVVQYELTVADIQDVLQAHIHLGPAGENGPVVAFLFGPSDGIDVGGEEVIAHGMITAADLLGPLEGMTIADLAAEMQRGTAYVNVHTVANPAGEIRGQIETGR